MHRRDFIKAVSAFVAVAAVAPETLATQPVDWTEWNNIELLCERDAITGLLINERDFSRSREARTKLAEMIHFDVDGIFIGSRHNGQRVGCQMRVAAHLPDSFKVGFQVKFHDVGPLPPYAKALPSFATNGQVMSDVYMTI